MTERCPLSHDTGCGWCGRTLTGRQKRWCSRACARAFTANHRWTQAKAAIKAGAAWYLCANARIAPGWDPIATVQPGGCLGLTRAPEVNHKVPCKGKHGSWGCHHHQDNLEVLCRPCHLKVTNEQRARGWE